MSGELTDKRRQFVATLLEWMRVAPAVLHELSADELRRLRDQATKLAGDVGIAVDKAIVNEALARERELRKAG